MLINKTPEEEILDLKERVANLERLCLSFKDSLPNPPQWLEDSLEKLEKDEQLLERACSIIHRTVNLKKCTNITEKEMMYWLFEHEKGRLFLPYRDIDGKWKYTGSEYSSFKHALAAVVIETSVDLKFYTS